MDGPWLGRSEPLRRQSDITEAADAAVDLLAGLSITEPVDWVCNAFGGHVGLKLATRPGILRSLAAISSPTEPIAPALRRQILLLRPLLRTIGAVGPVRSAILDAICPSAGSTGRRCGGPAGGGRVAPLPRILPRPPTAAVRRRAGRAARAGSLVGYCYR